MSRTRSQPREEFDADLVPISSGLDQPVVQREIFRRVMGQVDSIIAQMDEDQHPHVGMQATKTLLATRRISGIALAKILYFLSRRWESYGMDDEFKDRAYQEFGISPTTTGRYTLVWDMFENGNIPDAEREKLFRRPMKDLIMISQCWKQSGRRLTVRPWRQFANAADTSDLRDRINRYLGRETRSNALSITLNREGVLTAVEGSGDIETFGFLNVELAMESDLVEKAVNRIIRAAGVIYEMGDEV